MINRSELTHKQRIEAHQLRDNNPEAFDIWLLNYMDIIPESSNMKYQDFVYEYYIEKNRLDKIDSLLDDVDSMCND